LDENGVKFFEIGDINVLESDDHSRCAVAASGDSVVSKAMEAIHDTIRSGALYTWQIDCDDETTAWIEAFSIGSVSLLLDRKVFLSSEIASILLHHSLQKFVFRPWTY
jgi:hypothetical protein